MPHKGKSKKKSGKQNDKFDFAPVSDPNAGASKSLMRVLKAKEIRENYHKHKHMAAKQKTTPSTTSSTPHIKPGESLGDFNRRVESHLAGSISSAVKSSNRSGKKREREQVQQTQAIKAAEKAEKQKKQNDQTISNKKKQVEEDVKAKDDDIKDFAKAIPKSINDVADAPPSFNKIPRKARKQLSQNNSTTIDSPSQSVPRHKIPVSLAYQEAIEKERQQAISRYREMKNRTSTTPLSLSLSSS